mmetsp:Transcript_4030/g.14808  ORF Transcript_4030/g.14808 Transcript_4030/m.14808 type:complete len:244 (-) Transcript_4030:399-1130(-)
MSVNEKSGQSTSRKQSTACCDTPHRMKSLRRVSPEVRIRRSTGGTERADGGFDRRETCSPLVSRTFPCFPPMKRRPLDPAASSPRPRFRVSKPSVFSLSQSLSLPQLFPDSSVSHTEKSSNRVPMGLCGRFFPPWCFPFPVTTDSFTPVVQTVAATDSNAAPRKHFSSSFSETCVFCIFPAATPSPTAPTACAMSSLPVYAKHTFNTGPWWCQVLEVQFAEAILRVSGTLRKSPTTRTRTCFS